MARDMVEARAPGPAPAHAEPVRRGAAEALQLQALPALIGNRAMGRFARQLQRQAANPPRPTAGAAEQAAHQLHRAMDRWGTDEAAIFAALTGRTKDERDAIKAAYSRITRGRSLDADLR